MPTHPLHSLRLLVLLVAFTAWPALAQTIITPTVTPQGNGDNVITWPQTVARLYRLEDSVNQVTWQYTARHVKLATSTSGSFTDVQPAPGTVYRVLEFIPSTARLWNEQLLNAIRIDTPHPPKHARNLFHLATVMYDAWAAYDSTALGYIHHERISPLPGDVPAARSEAISYAAYRLLKARFTTGPNVTAINDALDAQMASLGYDTNVTTTVGSTPSALGNRIAATIIAWGLNDGSNESGGYSDPSYSNPQPPMIVLGSSGTIGGVPLGTDPNLWQPLALSTIVTQNGIPLPNTVQQYVGVTWLNTLPFALQRTSPNQLWMDPGPVFKVTTPTFTSPSDTIYKNAALELLIKSSQLNSTATLDISPGAIGNNPLGADTGTGHTTNPATGLPYAPNVVSLGDYARVMAEFWADGPDSETPPGHWHVLANELSDNPSFSKRLGGTGPVLDDLQWDVKTYFALAAGTHDAACACWGAKRYYEGVRPITMIRYLSTQGQSSDPQLPSYTPYGIPLMTDVCEVITADSSASGGKHEFIWDIDIAGYVFGVNHIGKVVVKSWPSEPGDRTTQTNTVRWMFGEDWVPYQRANFNSPAFPGYISGHSTFSRAAAEVLTALTGTPFVPGGLGTFVAEKNNFLVFERGPSETTVIQWATWYDAADLAGQSRRWGGIHPAEDDYPARVIGSNSGKNAWALALKYFSGELLTESIDAGQTWNLDGTISLSTPTRRGLFYQWEYSTDLQTWLPLTPTSQATDTTLTVVDTPPAGQRRFYRARWVAEGP